MQENAIEWLSTQKVVTVTLGNGRIKTQVEKLAESRQAAIDATWFEPSYTDPLNVLTEVRDRLKALPSAQPEIIRCKDCKYRDENWRRVSVRWLPCMEVRAGSNWYCGSAERRTDGLLNQPSGGD